MSQPSCRNVEELQILNEYGLEVVITFNSSDITGLSGLFVETIVDLN